LAAAPLPDDGEVAFAERVVTDQLILGVGNARPDFDLRYLKYAVQVAEAGGFLRRSAYRYRNPPPAKATGCCHFQKTTAPDNAV
jgi:hypothetical protein